ncbi:alpha,alpha-trehalase nth1, partial [Blyttiomyces sp. JEL0837]
SPSPAAIAAASNVQQAHVAVTPPIMVPKTDVSALMAALKAQVAAASAGTGSTPSTPIMGTPLRDNEESTTAEEEHDSYPYQINDSRAGRISGIIDAYSYLAELSELEAKLSENNLNVGQSQQQQVGSLGSTSLGPISEEVIHEIVQSPILIPEVVHEVVVTNENAQIGGVGLGDGELVQDGQEGLSIPVVPLPTSIVATPPITRPFRKPLPVPNFGVLDHKPVAKSKFELENDLDYHDSDHRHAHGHTQGAPMHRRTYSYTNVSNQVRSSDPQQWERRRRGSHDDFVPFGVSRKFIIDVEETKRQILEQEDTDGDCQITVQDAGPKAFTVGTANSNGFHKFEIRGTYMLSNLLQELAWATDHNRKFITLDEDRLNENPVDRLNRLIKYHFWDGLTRRIDAEGLEVICADPKNRQKDQRNRIYVPFHDEFGYNYYTAVAEQRPHLNLQVVRLPEVITPEYVKSKNTEPGILSLALRRDIDPVTGIEKVRGTPFVVPGGRFNEMYGWDSYFEALGLLVDGRIALAQGMVENFVYEIEHYGKILNANRSYYLTRSQPPFLTDMILQVYRAFKKQTPEEMAGLVSSSAYTGNGNGNGSDNGNGIPVIADGTPKKESGPTASPPPRRPWAPGELKVWLARGVRACVKELFSIWMAPPRLDKRVGLTKYYPEGIGIPPETEWDHFYHILEPYAKKYGVGVKEFETMYTGGQVKESELDEYFVHDRAIRESGHDTTYRFDARCANLATIDLNSLVYRYQVDLLGMLTDNFGGSLKFKVRRGKDDVYLKGFQAWLTSLISRGVDGTIGNNGGWDTTWAKGIIVFDHETDEEYHEWATSKAKPVPSQNAPTFPLPSFFIPDDQTETFTVVLPAMLFGSLAERTRSLIHQYLWDDETSLYKDFDCKLMQQSSYETATALWALWAGVATQEQASRMVPKCVELFEVVGGLVSGTESSRGEVGLDRPSRQWDYPYGWAPHQIMAWEGLAKYGYMDIAQRLTYRWLYTVVQAFVDFNGVVPEKFDVVGMTHRVNVEYGNVGTDFKFVVKEGFGWMNASFQVGLTYLTKHMRRALGTLTPPEQFFKSSIRKVVHPVHAADEDVLLSVALGGEAPLNVVRVSSDIAPVAR